MLLSISLVAACSQDSDSSTQALTSPDAQAGQAGSAGEEDTGQAGGGAAGQPGSVGGQGGISSTGGQGGISSAGVGGQLAAGEGGNPSQAGASGDWQHGGWGDGTQTCCTGTSFHDCPIANKYTICQDGSCREAPEPCPEQGGNGGASGQGGSSGGEAQGGAGGIPAGFAPVTCFPEGLATELKLDSIEILEGEFEIGTGEGIKGEWIPVFSDGKPCASAKDQAACLSLVDAKKKNTKKSSLSSEESLGPVPTVRRELLVITSGDQVTVLTSLEELEALLGPLDSLAKLGIWLRYTFLNGCNYAVKKVEGGYEVWVLGKRVSACPISYEDQLYWITAAGEIELLKSEPVEGSGSGACAGRRPTGFRPPYANASSPLGEFFAKLTYLETASVAAFERLHQELKHFHAPEDLVTECLDSAADEVRHAAHMLKLTKRFRGAVDELYIPPACPRSLLDLAIENAVEGCVRETYGALEASYQAKHASDLQIRTIMHEVARDETSHAALSWRLHFWLKDMLSEADWHLVESAMAEAIHDLRSELRVPRNKLLTRVAGLPNELTAQSLLDGLEEHLWGARSLAA